MGRHTTHFVPRLMPAPAAAAYLGVSESTLRTLELPRKMLGAKRLYDVIDLDAYASSLPTEGETGSEANTCDEIMKGLGLG